MHRYRALLLVLGASLACAQTITIQNSGFETATLATGGYQCNLIAGSLVYPTAGTLGNWTAYSTTANAAAGAEFTGLQYPAWTNKWWTGTDFAYLQIDSAGSVWLAQTLAATLQSNTTYTLSAIVARPLDTAPPGAARYNYALELWAGTTLLGSASNLTGMPVNTSATDSLIYSSGANNLLVGQPLTIILAATGLDGVNTIGFFDNISLTASGANANVSTAISASAFGAFSSVTPGTWVEIYGANLSSDSRSWAGSDFNGTQAPISLDGTSVTVGGEPAFIDYISPTQVNALLASNTPTGAQQMVVTSPTGGTTQYSVMVNAVEPGLLAPTSFKIGAVQYVVALFHDGTYALPSGAIGGINSRPAKPGDTITLYGVGFGPVTPAIAAGQLVRQANSLAFPFQVTIGGIPATIAYDGLAPSFTGLYQFNLTVPQLSAGDAALTFTLNGAAGAQTLYIPIGN